MQAALRRAAKGPVDRPQVIDFTKTQKRQNRSFRRFEVHGGYAGSDQPVAGHANDLLPSQKTMFLRTERGCGNAGFQRQWVQP